ncbi:hypothetical protein HG531_003064 [Fusarium graminearum]|nr:hypothetical protein HG531_003064 [Fusarium graminearum]
MTTAHRPTFDPARGKEALRGPAYHQRLLPAHTQLKYRQAGQGGDADEPTRDLAAELLAAEATHFTKKNGAPALIDDADEDDEASEAERLKEEEDARERNIALGNPLLNKQDFNMKRRWDDDVVFKNQARGTEEKGKKKEFVNDLLRSDFHRRFMSNLLGENLPLQAFKGSENVAVLLVDSLTVALVDSLDVTLLSPSLADKFVKGLVWLALKSPESLVGSAQGAGVATDVELVNAITTTEGFSNNPSNGWV